jgi:Bax protein
MIKKNFSLGEIKKYLKYKGLTIIKKNKKNNTFIKNSNIGSIPRTILSSVIIISFFLITPFIINFQNEREMFSKEFENNSKDNFKKTLEGKNTDRTTKVDEELNVKDLFEDIFEFDELPSDVVRLNASTIEQLFKDTNYNLNDVREKKLVKPVSLSLLPKEMKMIENTKKRKELFIQIILPLVIDENNKIRIDRNKLFHVLNKRNNSKSEKRWLQEKFKLYGVKNRDLSTLKIRMDEIPTSLAIAQAAKETGWGTSRFALEGNALFGQWTWTGEGIKPAGADNNSTHKVMKFKILQASIKAYHRNLNTHSSYREFRRVRAELRQDEKELDSILLSEHLDKYAATGKDYVRILQTIIRQNKLTDFDDAKLLPSSNDLESLI